MHDMIVEVIGRGIVQPDDTRVIVHAALERLLASELRRVDPRTGSSRFSRDPVTQHWLPFATITEPEWHRITLDKLRRTALGDLGNVLHDANVVAVARWGRPVPLPPEVEPLHAWAEATAQADSPSDEPS
jgi:hypothetical protein